MELDRRHSDSANMARLAINETTSLARFSDSAKMAPLAINENATAYGPRKTRKEKHTYQNTDITFQGKALTLRGTAS